VSAPQHERVNFCLPIASCSTVRDQASTMPHAFETSHERISADSVEDDVDALTSGQAQGLLRK
jgi:hypothetical protein